MTTTPRVNVGTYAKNNNGSEGSWIDLEDHDAETFRDACLELHQDEHDTELIFQDFEGFPREFYGERYLDPKVWDWLELTEDEQELLAVYLEHVNQDGTIDEARDAYAGKYDSEEDWASGYLEDTGSLASVPENLRYYIDLAAYAQDAGIDSVHFAHHNGDVWVFYR